MQQPSQEGDLELWRPASPGRRLDLPELRKEVTMASQSKEPATNERIVRLLEEVKAQLADSREQQRQIARDVTHLLERK
jgi:hypothetical protein